jgi:hypothetical protein
MQSVFQTKDDDFIQPIDRPNLLSARECRQLNRRNVSRNPDAE